MQPRRTPSQGSLPSLATLGYEPQLLRSRKRETETNSATSNPRGGGEGLLGLLMTLLFNFGLMSLLMLAAHLVRSQVKCLQDYSVPSARCSPAARPSSPDRTCSIGSPFASQRTGDLPRPADRRAVRHALSRIPPPRTVRLSRAIHQVGDTFFYSLATEFGQYGLALLLGLFVLALYPELNPAFALMLPAGFAGGPGHRDGDGGGLETVRLE